MNAFIAFMILKAFQIGYCLSIEEAETDGEAVSLNKTLREVEAFTTILLDNESFTIVSAEKHPIVKSIVMSQHRKDGLIRIGNKLRHDQISRKFDINESAVKSHNTIGLSGRSNSAETLPKHHQDKISTNKHTKNARSPKKHMRKRHFEPHVSYYAANPSELKRSKSENELRPSYRFVLTEAPKSQTKGVLTTARNFGEKPLTNPNQHEDFLILNANPWEHAEHLTTKRQSVEDVVPFSSSLTTTESDPTNPKRDSFPKLPPSNGNSLADHNVEMIRYKNDSGVIGRSTGSWMTTVAAPVRTMTFHQADIIQRNLAAALEQQKHKKNEADNSPGDGSDIDDTVITFDGMCDQIENQNSCVIQREVGDVLTLAVKINSPRKPDSFQIRWMKVYHKFDSNKGKPLEIESAKLPWNMVSGSEGRELRLNPVTNSDIDPNCFMAKVFLMTKNHGKVLFTQLKKLIFRIEIPIIDMGKLYAGEELSVNIENFMSLPERGNLLFQWNLETKPREYESLPSNIKVSTSGRSVVLKELKKGRLGVLNCVVYSSNRYAIAKRRFNILKIVDNLKRRSATLSLEDDSRHDLLRSLRCRHVIRRSQEEAKQRLIDGNKPKSRQKRNRRRESVKSASSEIDCEPLRMKMYSRFVRSLLRDITTEDPRLMPLEKLFELSEKGDGTLDDVIPREVHYVSPKVKLIPGTSAERSVGHPAPANCTRHSDCPEHAVCVFPEDMENSTVVRSGNCNCRPEYYRDGTQCRKIPSSSHREKRLRRNARNDFAVKQHLFYHNAREIARTTADILEVEEFTELPKVLAFEEEESFLLSDCIDDKDCSMHANCVQPTNGHPYCKCRPGFRGNGIFCWETMDYVPPEEQFLNDEEMDSMDQSDMSVASRTVEPPEIEEEV